jgi:hypothetical protein
MVEFSRASGRIVAITALVALSLAPAIGGSVRAQTHDDDAAGSINLGARGGLAAEAPVGTVPRQDGTPSSYEFSGRAGFASDYIYRGVTLSDHKPAVGAGLEVALGLLYAGATVTSVELPSRPAAEITMSGGVRPKLWDINLDFGWTSFFIPARRYRSVFPPASNTGKPPPVPIQGSVRCSASLAASPIRRTSRTPVRGASTSSVGGTSRPSALAVLRLINNSSLVGNSTGNIIFFASRSEISMDTDLGSPPGHSTIVRETLRLAAVFNGPLIKLSSTSVALMRCVEDPSI